ncbi:unnamed protein product [Allacma fusca]|uniref:Uncharacterized protein n=1 Tax=Allacma fusca TaxID=39272 RepID=A0A8J2JLS3_9HEXA|nr:unnamed protein product [Allacma fusca]
MTNCKSHVALPSRSSDDDDFQLPSTSIKVPAPVHSSSKIVPLSVKNRINCVSCPYGPNEKQNRARLLSTGSLLPHKTRGQKQKERRNTGPF